MLCLLMFTALAGAETNLLQNPAFLHKTAETPHHWNLFVMEHPALPANTQHPYGTIDEKAREGEPALMLHNTVKYRNEPCNNWSQIIWENLAGKKISVKGSIKTQDATAAAIWVQSWQRTPYRLLHVKSTSDRTPISGANPWKNVEMTLQVPQNTDFIIIRCVLRGTGKAWFGPLSVSEITDTKPHPGKKPEPPQEKEPEQDIKQLDQMLQSLMLASKANHDLMVQVQNLQNEIIALREQLSALQQVAAASPEKEKNDQPDDNDRGEPQQKQEKPRKVPPLVPHGMKPEDFQ